MSFREWLILIGVVFILIVAIDGVRRARRARRDSLEMSLGMGADLGKTPLDDDFNPELGAVRVVGEFTRTEPVMDDDTVSAPRVMPSVEVVAESDDEVPPPAEVAPLVLDEALESPVAVSLEDGEPTQKPWVDRGSSEAVLGERVEDEADQDEPAMAAPEPAFTVHRSPVSDSVTKPREAALVASRSDHEPLLTAAELDALRPDISEGILSAPRPAKPGEKKIAPAMKRFTASVRGKISGVVNGDKQARAAEREQAASTAAPRTVTRQPREVIILNVMADLPDIFRGRDLVALFEACGMAHGDMGIYHRHETASNDSPVQFSVASGVQPGTFNPDEVEQMQAPGVSFFVTLPGPDNAMRAFDYMLETANCVVRNLGGSLKDERRSDMTLQTIEHCRQRIRDFERRQLSERA